MFLQMSVISLGSRLSRSNTTPGNNQIKHVERGCCNLTSVNYRPFFNSVAHVWVPGAKTIGPIVKKFGFS
jgi:hypothetical protein